MWLGLGHTTIEMTANYCGHGHDSKCTQSHYQKWTPCCCNVLGDYCLATRLCQLTRVSSMYCSLYFKARVLFQSQQADRWTFFTSTMPVPAGFPHNQQFVCLSAVRSFLFDIWLSLDCSIQIWLDTSFVAVITAVAVVILGSNGTTMSTVRQWHDNEYNGHIQSRENDVDRNDVDKIVVVANFIVV